MKTADGRVVTTRPHEPVAPGQCGAITVSGLRCSRSAQWDELCFQHRGKVETHDETCQCNCDWCNMTDTPCWRCRGEL